jgi:nucleoside-diphosphate-sugar epimerase
MADFPIFVAGASGLLGRNTVLRLVKNGSRVVSLGRTDPVIPGVEHRTIDLNQAFCADDIAAVRPRAMISFVSAPAGASPELHETVTLELNLRLLSIAAKLPNCRFVTFGSAAEFGRVSGTNPLKEETARNPVSPYGAAKARLMDAVARAAQLGQDVVGVRPFSIIGSGMGAHTLPGRVRLQLENPLCDVVVTGSLEGARDMTAVDPIARLLSLLVVRADRLPHWIHAGTGQAIMLRHFVSEMIRQSGRVLEVREVPLPDAITAGGTIISDNSLLRSLGCDLPPLPIHSLAAEALGSAGSSERAAFIASRVS